MAGTAEAHTRGLVVALALLGPGLVALLGTASGLGASSHIGHILGLAAILAIAAVVLTLAVRAEGYSLADLGLSAPSWWTLATAGVLAAFFIVAYGPFVSWLLAKTSGGGFEAGIEAARKAPSALLVVTIVLVGTAEELLYRGYAIARLTDLTGSRAAAVMISVVAFGLAHIPSWGLAPALTTMLAGAVMSIVYLWRHDVLALAMAHVATDLWGIALAP